MRTDIIKSMNKNQIVEMIYMSSDGEITKRRVKIYKMNKQSFQAYCYLRQSTRTFKIDHVLALVPVVKRERMVI